MIFFLIDWDASRARGGEIDWDASRARGGELAIYNNLVISVPGDEDCSKVRLSCGRVW
jgi:hypothetical protein